MTYNYTHEWVGNGADFKSSSVDNVWYNINDRTAVIDWNDSLYLYKGVDFIEVDKVVNSYSVGTVANRFKQNYGPGVKLGSFWDTDLKKEKVKVSKTYEYSLSLPKVTAVVAGKQTKHVFYFDLNGVERQHVVYGHADIDNAIKALEDGAAALGSNIVIKRVDCHFV